MLSKRVKQLRQIKRRNRRQKKSWEWLRLELYMKLDRFHPGVQTLLSAKHITPDVAADAFIKALRARIDRLETEQAVIRKLTTKEAVHAYHRNFHLRTTELLGSPKAL